VLGKSYYGLGRSDTVVLIYEPSKLRYSQDKNIEISGDFGGKKGFIGLQVIISFPSQGDEDTDLTYLKSYFDYSVILYSYQFYKP
jgi:hypothetical protein